MTGAFLSSTQASEHLGLSVAKVNALFDRGILDGWRDGPRGHRHFKRDSVEAFAKNPYAYRDAKRDHKLRRKAITRRGLREAGIIR